jgi:hypothetical protein
MGDERPHALGGCTYELLDGGDVVRMIVPTCEGDAICYILLPAPMTEAELNAETHGRGKRALELLPARGHA